MITIKRIQLLSFFYIVVTTVYVNQEEIITLHHRTIQN